MADVLTHLVVSTVDQPLFSWQILFTVSSEDKLQSKML